ncbi:DNA polymerase IV [Salinarchaeum sp. IM2453]|uniref:DNA polymerase IV n=1 Tax=Salinarchaeum sp. IM2453 TaxID=2862870 RepID=UPI001C82CC09|nr:DNA polymerase IV [Salinarchaeum sp. IM2453]QZA88597.1 DNA polymerase IV [Salinarchaeum sp. IM2453]
MSHGGTLPGTEREEDRIVLHVDLDCFYAACERLKEPDLENKPVIVGMGYEPGTSVGAVATASYEAREYGIESAQPISSAIDRLPPASQTNNTPAGYYRPVDMEFYESVAEDIQHILEDCADVLRVVSIDEAYLDVTDRTAWDVAEGYGRYVRDRIQREVGLTASVGIAPTMHAAKVASDHDKPDGLVVVPPGTVEEFLADLPIEDLHGIGPVTARELRELNIGTIGELAAASLTEIEDQYGDRGRTLHRRARGIDTREVTPRGRPKSLSKESAFTEPTSEYDAIAARLETLADAVAERASAKNALYQTIGIKVVIPPYDINTRAHSLPGPIDDPDLIHDIATDLFEEFRDTAVRKVGIRVSNLSFADGEQSNLAKWETVEQESAHNDHSDDTETSDSNSSSQRTIDQFYSAESDSDQNI